MQAAAPAANAPVPPFQRLDFRGFKPQTNLPSSFEATLTGIRAEVEKIRAGQFSISAQLRGYQPQINNFDSIYAQWQIDLNKFKPQIRGIRTKLKQEESKIPLLAADGETTAKLMVQYRALYQELRFLKYQAIDLLVLIGGEAHKKALELYKTTMKDCDKLWHAKGMSPLDKFKKLHDMAKTAIQKIDVQQAAIKDTKGSLLGNEVTTLHRRVLEYFIYHANNHRKSLPEGDTEERRELTRLDTLVEGKRADITVLIAMHNLNISEEKQQLIPFYLDDTREVTLPKAQEMRQSRWDLFGLGTKAKNWWYSGIGDGQVSSQLRQVGLSINKVLSALQGRILELACGNLSPDQDFANLKEEETFFRACRHELSRRLREQQQALYDSNFDEKMHAGIYTVDQRNAGCADIKLHTTMFHQLGTNRDIEHYLRAHGKLLQFLKQDNKLSPGYITSYEAVKGLFDATMALAKIPALQFNKKDHFHRYGQKKTYPIVRDTIQNTAHRTLALVGLEQMIQDQVLSGERLEDLVKQKDLTELPEVVKSCIAKEIYRFLFYTTDSTNAKLDLFLHALQKTYKPLFDKAIRDDAQFKAMIDTYSSLSDWNSNEKSQQILDLLVTISQEIGTIARNPSKDGDTPHPLNGELNFVRYCNARQKFVELQSRDHSLAGNSPACMDRIMAFRPSFEKQLGEIDRREEYPGFFAHLGTFVLMPTNTKEISKNEHLITIGPEQRVQVLYKHLVTYLFGNSDKKHEIANTLHVILTNHRPDTNLTLIQDVNEPKQKYLLILLYRFLLECLAKVDFTNPHHCLSPREYNLLRNFLEKCYRKDDDKLRALWNAQYSPAFMHNALRSLMKLAGRYQTQEADNTFLKSWTEFSSNLSFDEHYQVWTRVFDSYNIFISTLGDKDVVGERSVVYETLKLHVNTAAEAIGSRPKPADSTYGDLLAAAIWCKGWMFNELARVTPKQNQS